MTQLSGVEERRSELVLLAASDADIDHPYVDSITVFDNAHLVTPSDTLTRFAITVAIRTCGTTTNTRASKIATVIIPVADQDGAVDFYVNKLGFEKRVDIPFGNGYRWVEVRFGDEATTIALAPPPDEGAVGKRDTGISLQTDDIDAYHAELQQAGVDVDAEVSRMGEPVPPMFWLRDPEGNTLMVVQQRFIGKVV